MDQTKEIIYYMFNHELKKRFVRNFINMTNILSNEQIERLKQWKESLKSDVAKNWKKEEDNAEEEIHKIINETGFENGNKLSENQIDNIFHLMKKFSANRALSNLLYRENGVEEFNDKLRKLLFGEDSEFVERIDGFFQLKGIGVQTLSQFLVVIDPTKYPLMTSLTKELLELDSKQDEDAYQIAMERFGVSDKSKYLKRTLDYLRDLVIFEEIKNSLALEKYSSVNNLIWFARKLSDEDEQFEALKEYSSVSLESDLRDYLENKLHLIEKGLKLIKKEFDTGEVGQIDLLCKDKDGYTVVVELKKGRTNDKVVGQTLRYLGWIIENQTKKARAIIIVNEPDEKLNYALKPLEDKITLKYYKVNFEISDKYKNS